MSPTRIREIRAALRMSQIEFARRLGLATKGAVSHLESGRREPKGPTLALLQILEGEADKKSGKIAGKKQEKG